MKLDKKFLEESKKQFENDRTFRIAQRAVSSNGLLEATLDKREDELNRFEFNVSLPEKKMRNQKSSGRCWIFAAMNVIEHKLIEKYNLKEYELSQNYIFFYDKLERANYFYHTILDTADRKASSRIINHLLAYPMGDGGQWDMIKNIINKYGIVPSKAMPDTANSIKSGPMNDYLNKMLRMNAKNLRNAFDAGKDMDILKEMVKGYMVDMYNALSLALGTPPEKVDFETRDKDGKVISYKNLSPKEFFELSGMDLNQYASLINAPTQDKPFYQSYTVERLGNVVEGEIIRYVNVPIEVMKKAVTDQLRSGEAVWFGCDVGQFFSRDTGRLDLTTVNVFDLINVDYNFSKAERLDHYESQMTHAMVFVGVEYDEEKDKSLRYKVENSWGEDSGIRGYLVMSDEWFDEYMYQALINKDHLSEEVLEAYQSEPNVLQPWDPMGSLA